MYRTSKSMNCSRPFLLSPIGKDYLWGGDTLKRKYRKTLKTVPLAESWECSTHPEGCSIVYSGEYAGMRLDEVLRAHPEYLGTNHETLKELPIMIKFIDAAEKLSIQVHPDDDYAKKYENGALGKTELWYILEAEEQAELIYGFYRELEEQTVRKSLEEKTIEKYLQKVKVKKDDVFYIEPGTVHAIGAGIVLVEIQENSNLTYRLYDYDRLDKNGKKRELHIEKAMANLNLQGSNEPRQPMRLMKYVPGCASELLCRCKYFQVERMLVQNKDINRDVLLQTGSTSFHVLLCLEGEIILKEDEEKELQILKGDCLFIPANSVKMVIRGKAQLLRVSC